MAERELTAADWRGYSEAQFPQGSWSLDDNVLRALATGPRVDLITRERFRDFTLFFEWRLPRGGNSGVLYRVAEDLDHSWQSGPEMQLLDDEHHQDGANALTACGALYGLIAPWHDLRDIANAYHSARLVVQGSRVEHWIDDTQVLGYDLESEEARERIAHSKFREWPQYGRLEEGHIALQHQGTEAWFRRLRIET
ncbi:MAG: 3-keto-disaccharide hydrolase [Steroidobacteraceae bacterium]